MNKRENSFRVKGILSLMFFIACLINTLLEFYREIAIITKQITSSFYFIKLFLSLPIILLTMNLIQKALNVYKFITIMNIILLFFIISFFLLGIIHAKYEKNIQKGSQWAVDIFCDGKMIIRGLMGLRPFLYMYSEWVSTYSYVVSELWSSVMVGFALYTLSNYCCTEQEMKEIVPYFSSITGLSMLLTVGFIFIKDKLDMIHQKNKQFNSNSLFNFTMFFCCLLIYFLKLLLPIKDKEKKETKTLEVQDENLTLLSLLKSRVLRNMCLIAIIYAVNAGYVDMTFKNALSSGSKFFNMSPKDYSMKFTITSLLTISIVSLTYNFFVRGRVKFGGLFFSFIISPCSALFFTTCLSFLALYNLRCSIENTKINLENWVGAIALAFSKITKYVLFDLAKEMISMRIPLRYRYKYKSVYDGICIKLGKSVVSFYGAIATFLGVNDIRNISNITLLFLIALNLLWIKCVYYLNEKYIKSIDHNQEIDVET